MMVENLDQSIVMTTFNKGLLADPVVIDNPKYDGLHLNTFKRYYDTWVLIFNMSNWSN